MLSAVKYGDDDVTIDKKLKLISEFLEKFIVLRLVNSRSLGSSALSYSMFNLIKEVRNRSLPELADICRRYIAEMNKDSIDFSKIVHYGLTERR